MIVEGEYGVPVSVAVYVSVCRVGTSGICRNNAGPGCDGLQWCCCAAMSCPVSVFEKETVLYKIPGRLETCAVDDSQIRNHTVWNRIFSDLWHTGISSAFLKKRDCNS